MAERYRLKFVNPRLREYDDEWFEEEQELMDDLYGEALDVEELFEEVEEFMEEIEVEREIFFNENEIVPQNLFSFIMMYKVWVLVFTFTVFY